MHCTLQAMNAYQYLVLVNESINLVGISNNNNTGLLYSAFSIISSKRFTQYYPRIASLVGLPIAAMEGEEASIP